MKKKLIGRLLSLSLSAVLAFTGFSTPVYAAEMDIELTDEEGDFEEAAEEEEFLEDDYEVLEEEEDLECEEIPEEEPFEEYSEEDFAEDFYAEEVVEEAAEDEDAEFEAVSKNSSSTITVVFHSNYRGKDTTVKRFFDKNNLDNTPINYTSLFSVGYDKKFIGWEINGEIKETVTEAEVVEYAVANNLKTVDIYAQWESMGTYFIKLNAGVPAGCLQKSLWGHSDGNIIPAEVGEPIALGGNEFTLPGYELVGWTYKDSKGKTVKVSKPEATIPALSTTEGATCEITALWKLGTYTITYDFNGGTSNSSNKVTYKLDAVTVNELPLLNYVADSDDEYGFVINTKNPEVTRDGFIFAGWDKYESERCYGGTTFTNMSLMAQWKPIPYIARYDGNGGIVNNSSEIYNYDTTAGSGYSNVRAVRKGYTHKGWKAKVKGKEKTFKVSDIIWMKDIDRSDDGIYYITAVWEANKYSITYNLKDGTIAKAPKKFKTGDGTVIPTPTKPGYKFTGWQVYQYDDEEKNSSLVDAEEAGYIKDGKLTEKANEDLTLYAGWSLLYYDFTFKNSDGSDLKDAEGNVLEAPKSNEIIYTSNVDFAAAAAYIEESGALGDKSIAGFATKTNAKKPEFKLNVKYTKFLAKGFDGDGERVPVIFYVVPQDKVYRISYDTAGGEVKKGTYSYTAKQVTGKKLSIKAVADKKGRSFIGWKSESEAVVKDDKGYVKAVKAGAAENIVLTAEYGEVNTYSIMLMPGAAGVKDADGNAIDAKAGKLYKVGDLTEFSYDDTEHILLNEGVGWTREGYIFADFYKDTKFKDFAYYAGKLGSGKDKVVKVYARWIPKHYTVESYYDEENKYYPAIVYRDGKLQTAKTDFSYVGYRWDFEDSMEYGKKDYKPFTIKAPGYNFLGWQIVGETTADMKVTYTDSSKKYVKSILKTNTANIVLQPVFEENSYELYVNTNGGTFEGKSGKFILKEKVFFTDTIAEQVSALEKGAKKSGNNIYYISTSKNYRDMVQSQRYKYYYNSRLATKQGAKVVLNIIWYEVKPGTPKMHAAYSYISDNKLYMDCTYGISKGYSALYFEYSTSADFSNNVKKYIQTDRFMDDEGIEIIPSVTVLPGKNYYVRVKYGIIDSTGDYYYGNWSNTIMISSPATSE